MKSMLRTALFALMVGAVSAPVAPSAALAQTENPDNAPVMGWGQFSDMLDQRQLQQFTGVSGGYVAFVLCSGSWYRVRASVAQVVQALQQRNYQPSCSNSER